MLRRVLDAPRTTEQLRLPPVTLRLAEQQRGLVLVCGPTGSGKTSTLGAMVDHINRTRPVHIVTLEDPIEILHRDQRAWVSQREIGIDLPDFGTGMRAAVREDPDVIVVGEMRDRETVVAALTAAETGHLVLSSLHTTDAAETVNRIVELFPDDQRHQIRLVLAEIVADSEFYGMQTFDQSLASLYEDEVIDLRDALSAATNPHDLTVSLRRQGLPAHH